MMKYPTLLFFVFTYACLQYCNATTTDFFNYVLHDNLTVDDVTKVKEKLDSNIHRMIEDFELDVKTIGKINVNIWHDKENYLNAMEKNIGFRYESAGYLSYSGIYILLIDNPLPMINSSGLLYSFTAEEIAEHELAHCLSLRVNSGFTNMPRWLWEVVAVYESNEFYHPNDLSYLKRGEYPTIKELNQGFEKGDYRIYQVGYLIGEYIMSEWGKSGMLELIRRNGNIEYLFKISMSEFEAGWKSFVDAKYFGINNSGKISDVDLFDVRYNSAGKFLMVNIGNVKNAEITIYNIQGQEVYHLKSGINIENIDVSGFKSGSYIIQFYSDGRFATKKILIR